MAFDENLYLQEVQNRVEYYVFLSKNPDIKMQSLKVYQHPQVPKQHFIVLDYWIEEQGVFHYHREMETFVRARAVKQRGWLCLLRESTHPNQIDEFLKEAKLADIKTDHVKFTSHDDKAKV